MLQFEHIIEKFKEPENQRRLLQYLWIISLGMLVLGYIILFYLLFRL